MDIGIITLATGRYPELLPAYMDSFNKYFFTSHTRTFVYAADREVALPTPCQYVYFPHAPWPMATLNKMKAINRCKPYVENCDIVFWTDVDLNAVADVTKEDEVFPTQEQPICCVRHCGWLDIFGNTIFCDPYEKNPKSLAYAEKITVPYHQACFFGGLRKEFFEMTEHIEKNIDIDLENGIIAVWHDETHLNRYFQDHPPKTIPREYSRPVLMGYMPGQKIVSVLKEDSLRGI